MDVEVATRTEEDKRMKMAYDSERVLANAHDRGHGWATTTVELKDGETAWNPASTKSAITGPAHLEYDIAPDGGVVLTIDAPRIGV
jgi:hypothetical protein